MESRHHRSPRREVHRCGGRFPSMPQDRLVQGLPPTRGVTQRVTTRTSRSGLTSPNVIYVTIGERERNKHLEPGVLLWFEHVVPIGSSNPTRLVVRCHTADKRTREGKQKPLVHHYCILYTLVCCCVNGRLDPHRIGARYNTYANTIL